MLSRNLLSFDKSRLSKHVFSQKQQLVGDRVTCQPNYKYSSAKLSSNYLHSSSKAIGTSARLSSTIVHSRLSTGSCFEKNPTAKLYHKTRSRKLQSIALLFICPRRKQKPSL